MRNNKGITMVALMVTVAIMIILAVTITVNFGNFASRSNQAKFETDIKAIREEINQYYARNKELPILNKYTNTSMLGDVRNVNDNDNYYVVDLSKISVKLNFGSDYDIVKDKSTSEELSEMLDIYIINENSHTIYNPKGVEYYGKVNYTDINTYTKISMENGRPIISYTVNPITGEGLTQVTVNVTAKEPMYGIQTIEIVETGEIIECSGETEITKSFNIISNGIYTIEVTSTEDEETRDTVLVNQIVEGSIDIIPSTTEWTNQDITITIKWTEEQGLSKEYSLDGITWNNYTGAFSISSNGSIFARQVDSTNTTGTITKTLPISNIDKVAPTITSVTNSKTYSSITLNAAGTDEGSGIQGYQYYLTSWSGTESATKTYSGLNPETTYNLYVRAVDNVGNVGEQSGPYQITTNAVPMVEIYCTAQTEVNRLKHSLGTGASAVYNSTDGGILLQSATVVDKLAVTYLDGFKSTYMEFELGSFGTAVAGSKYTYVNWHFSEPYFNIRLQSGRTIKVVIHAYCNNAVTNNPSPLYQYITGGASNNGKLVINDSVSGITSGTIQPKDTYSVYKVVIEGTILKIYRDNVVIHQVTVASTDRIVNWEFNGTNAWWNDSYATGTQQGRMKYIRYNNWQ